MDSPQDLKISCVWYVSERDSLVVMKMVELSQRKVNGFVLGKILA